MAEPREPIVTLTPTRSAIALAVGLAAGLLLVIAPYGSVWLFAVATGAAPGTSAFTAMSGFAASLTLLFPLVQGIALGVALGPQRRSALATALLVLVLMVIELAGAAVFLREGVICLVILTPLIYSIMIAGAFLGRWLARRKARAILHASLAPLIVLAVLVEATGPKPEFAAEVTDSVVVNAPPENVWRYVVSYPENRDPPEYWLWQIGLPHPTQSIAEAPAVGAKRICAFDTGIAFEERITELTPNQVMTFEVTAQPDHPEVTGHFQFDRGQIRLTRNPDGTTTITATSWYRLFVRPAEYFNWWTVDITRQVHFRVLNHMKALAEADYQATEQPLP
jgi:uncharacterized protein YndB with AHSA1/START domain